MILNQDMRTNFLLLSLFVGHVVHNYLIGKINK